MVSIISEVLYFNTRSKNLFKFCVLVHFDTLIFNVNKIIQKKILSITSDKNDFNGTKLYTKFDFEAFPKKLHWKQLSVQGKLYLSTF